MKRIILAIVICICSINLIAQEGATAKFTRYDIKGMGTIDIPATLEISENEIGLPNSNSTVPIIFTPSGMKFSGDGTELKECIMICINSYKPNGLNLKYNFNERALNILGEKAKQRIIQTYSADNIISIDQTRQIKIKGNICVVSSCVVMVKNEKVIISVYTLFDKTKSYEITTSYRLSEESYWKEDFEKAIKSITIK